MSHADLIAGAALCRGYALLWELPGMREIPIEWRLRDLMRHAVAHVIGQEVLIEGAQGDEELLIMHLTADVIEDVQ